MWEVSLASTHCKHLKAHEEVLCHSLLGHSESPMCVMAGKRLPAWVQRGVRGQSGCWSGCTPLFHWLRSPRGLSGSTCLSFDWAVCPSKLVLWLVEKKLLIFNMAIFFLLSFCTKISVHNELPFHPQVSLHSPKEEVPSRSSM